MVDNKMLDSNILIKDEIKNLIKYRKKMYKSVLITAAYSKNQDSWKNAFTIITLSNKDGGISEKLEYPNFILNRVGISIDEFLTLLDILISKGELKIKNSPVIKANGNFDQDTHWRYRPSNDDWLKNEWPTDHYKFNIGNEGGGHLPSDALVSDRYPHFPDGYRAIKFYTNIDVANQSSSIYIFLPNYQVKIDKLSIGSEHLDLKIILNNIKEDEIIGKLYCEKEELVKSENFLIDENPKRIYIGFIPDFISVYLLKNDGETLDFRRVYLNWPSSTSKDIVIDVKEGDVLSMIELGENQHIEFKKKLNDKDKKEFAETVVAFSNGKGGAILIGVDDNSRIVGCDQDKIEEAIINIIRSRCDPFIEPEIKEIRINERSIIVVRINEGNNKPYVLRDKGVYVRSGSTDRSANRFELDEFYKKDEYNKFGV